MERAYAPWVTVIGRRPAPMDDDYGRHVAAGEVFVCLLADAIAAVAVIVTHGDHLLLDNVAVDPTYQGRGLGREMLRFVETKAAASGLGSVRLFTHARMDSNIGLYKRSGYRETHRATVDGFSRVFMEKPVDR